MRHDTGRKSKAPYLVRAEEFLGRLRLWAGEKDDVRALIVVGSFARGDARPDSDLDVVLLASHASRYLGRSLGPRRSGYYACNGGGPPARAIELTALRAVADCQPWTDLG